MLNTDDSSKPPPSSSISIAAIINDRPSKTPPSPPSPPSQSVQKSLEDNSLLPRKRQRIDDEDETPSHSAQSPIVTQTHAREQARGSISGGPSAISPKVERRESVVVPEVKEEQSGAQALEPTIKDVQPVDDLTRFISDFIFLTLNEREYEHLEVLVVKKVQRLTLD